MKRLSMALLLCVLSAAWLGRAPSAAQTPLNYAAGTLFIENVGQYPDAVRFWGLTEQGPAFFTADGFWLHTTAQPSATGPQSMPEPSASSAVFVQFQGANPAARIEPIERLATQATYLLGADPNGWHQDVPVWAGIRYHELYPGIDLELRSDAHGHLSRRLIAAPGADLAHVALRIHGAQSSALTAAGLHITTQTGALTLPLFTSDAAPTAQPRLDGALLQQPFAAPQSSAPQTTGADKYFAYYRTFGGSGSSTDAASNIAVHAPSQALYFVGSTTSPNFPTTGSPPYPTYRGGPQDGIVGKLSATGLVEFLTFLGGNGRDHAYDVTLASNGQVLITGETNSADFPIVGGFDTSIDPNFCSYIDETTAPCPDVFVARLAANGQTLLGSTYFGGESFDYAYSIAEGADGKVYVAGRTASANFPTHQTAYDRTLEGTFDAFITTMSAGLNQSFESTYYGGNGLESSNLTLGINGAGQTTVYLAGSTSSTNLPTTAGAVDPSANGHEDVYLARFNHTLDTLNYGTYYGGSSSEDVSRVYVSQHPETQAAMIVGFTQSPDFPIYGDHVLNDTLNGSTDGFMALIPITTAPATPPFSTYYGGSEIDVISAIDEDLDTGLAAFAGRTNSPDLQMSPNAAQRTFLPGVSQMGFVLTFDAQGLRYASYIGTGDALIADIKLEGDDYLYLAGYQDDAVLAAKLKLNTWIVMLPAVIR